MSAADIELREWNMKQREVILSPFNLWVTGEEVGHSPSIEEATLHFIEHGGAEALRKQFGGTSNKKPES